MVLSPHTHIYIYIYLYKEKLMFLNNSKVKSQPIFSMTQLALMIFPDMGKEGKEGKEIT